MDLTKKEIKAIEKFALACFEFKFAMEREKKKKQKNKPPKFPAGGVMVDRGEKTGDHSIEFVINNSFKVPNNEVKIPEHVSEKIKDFISQNVASEEQKINDIDVVKALSTSLFEDFHKHRNFPKENSVLLNYQYRIHPAIGSFISKLFYYSELRNGFGTEKEYIDIPRFPDPVIFFDTSNQRERAYETRELTGSYFNKREIDIICN